MNSRVYVEVDPFITKLLTPDYKEETLVEVKRFYNTVSYGDFKTILLEHHPDKPIYSNHKYHSLFDISEGFLGNSLSVNEISVWYVERIFEEIKDFEKVFLLINFEQQFVVENQLNSIRSVLIAKRPNWSKKNVLMWDLKKIITQIERIKINSHNVESKESSSVLANDNYITFDDNELYDLTSTSEEAKRLIKKLEMISKPSYSDALSFQQIKAIEFEFINENFNQLDFMFQDYKIDINESIIKKLIFFMEEKIKYYTDFLHGKLHENYELLWLGQSKTVFDSIIKFLMPGTIIKENKILNTEKFYFLHNMEEFNKDVKRIIDFKNYVRKKGSKPDDALDVTFESIHNIVDPYNNLSKNKRESSPKDLIEKRIQISGMKIGNTVIR
jgi:hypothetical protein